MINIKRLKNYFFRLLQTDSPYGKERATADVITQILRELDIGYFEDNTARLTGCDSGNIIVAGNGQARISFCAHMDTIRIYENCKVQTDDGLVHANGGGVLGIDDKSGVAVLLETIAVMQEKSGLPGDIHFIFTTSEEDGFLGAKYIDERHFSEAYNFVVDSGGVPIGYTINEGVAQYGFNVNITGKMSHTGGAGGVNSLVLAALLISSMKIGRLSENTFVNIFGITCQGNPNTVPENTLFCGQVLSFNDAEAQHILEGMKKLTAEFSKEHLCSIEFSYECSCERFYTSANSKIAEYARCAAEKAGLEFKLGRTSAGSDAHIFKQRGAQALKISNGMMNVHTREEYIRLDDMEKCVKYVLTLAGTETDGLKG